MTHKGHLAKIEYSGEDALFIGKLAGIDDVIGFHGESVELAVANEDAMQSPCACSGGCSQAPDSGATC